MVLVSRVGTEPGLALHSPHIAVFRADLGQAGVFNVTAAEVFSISRNGKIVPLVRGFRRGVYPLACFECCPVKSYPACWYSAF